MNTQYLREYMVLAESLSYSVAADRLFIKRPTLRSHIATLEEELGVSLVTKASANRIELTQAGIDFLPDAQFVLDMTDRTVQRYKKGEGRALTVRVGSVDFQWLDPILYLARTKTIEEDPDIDIDIISVDRFGIRAALEQDLVDLAVVSEKAYLSHHLERDKVLMDGMEYFKTGVEETYLLIPQSHPLFEKAEVRAADLAGVEILLPADICAFWRRDAVPEYLAALGAADIKISPGSFSDGVTYFAQDFDGVLGGVSKSQIARFGIGNRPEFAIKSIVDAPIISNFFVIYKKQLLENDIAQRLIESMKGLAADALLRHESK